MDIIIRQRPPILQLLAREDQALLVGRDAFFVLNLRFHIVDGVRGLDFEGDGFAREGFYEAGVRGLDLCWVDGAAEEGGKGGREEERKGGREEASEEHVS